MVFHRLVSAFFLMFITIFALFSLSIFQITGVMYIVCIMSAWEWSKMMRFPFYIHWIWMCIIFSLLYFIVEIMILNHYLFYDFWLIFECFYIIIIMWWILALFLILTYPNTAIFWTRSYLLLYLFGILMIIPFFWGMITLRYFFDFYDEKIGSWWLLYVISLVWITDSFAYFIGKIFGHRKLLKNVSPNKTWEGLIGGILVSTGFSWFCIKYVFKMSLIMTIVESWIIFFCSFGAIISSIIGDLVESMFKRAFGIKDSGYLIPGHGGILDRIDSLIAAVPIFVCLVLLVYTDPLKIGNI